MQFAKYAVEAAPELLKAGFDHPSKFDDVNASNLNALLSIRPPPIIVAMCGVTCDTAETRIETEPAAKTTSKSDAQTVDKPKVKSQEKAEVKSAAKPVAKRPLAKILASGPHPRPSPEAKTNTGHTEEAPQRPKSDHDTHTHTLAKKASTKSAITKSTSGNGSGAKGSIKAEGDSSHSPPVRTKSGVTKHHFDYDAVKVEVFESGWKKAKSQWTGTILCPTEEEARRIMAIDGKPDDRCFGKNVVVIKDPEEATEQGPSHHAPAYTGDNNKEWKHVIHCSSYKDANAMALADGQHNGKFFGCKIVLKP
uniref:Uncharacterized protein n=1 Tax=Eutreptiella gymnastica TaxID=73025 RepID=A0A7S4G4W2_9EUGL